MSGLRNRDGDNSSWFKRARSCSSTSSFRFSLIIKSISSEPQLDRSTWAPQPLSCWYCCTSPISLFSHVMLLSEDTIRLHSSPFFIPLGNGNDSKMASLSSLSGFSMMYSFRAYKFVKNEEKLLRGINMRTNAGLRRIDTVGTVPGFKRRVWLDKRNGEYL